jgi:hypothetical protein
MALISTLTDNFNDNSISASWTAGGDKWLEQNNELEFTTLTGGCDAYFYSNSSYDLTGSQATLKIVDLGNQTIASYAFAFQLQGGTTLYWRVKAGTIYAGYGNAFSGGTDLATASYVAATYKYLKIREASGTTYYDYSADGVSWTNFTSGANGSGITAKQVVIEVQSTAEASTTTAKVDDFNILPSATILTNVRYMES